MDFQTLHDLCLSKEGSHVEFPFGSEPLCIKANGRIFAQLYEKKGIATLKCTAAYGEMLRAAHPGVIVRGYHCPPVQQPYWNSLSLDAQIGEALWIDMVNQAYAAVQIGRRGRSAGG